MGPQGVGQGWAHMHAVKHLNIHEYIMFCACVGNKIPDKTRHLSCGLCCQISFSSILFYPASQMKKKSEFDHITYANDFNASFIHY